MIWATVSSWSCFCWLYSISIFGCKEYNQSDFGVDHLVMSICRAFSCVVERGCLLWPVHFLGKTLLVFALLHSAFQGRICLLLQVFLDFLLNIPVPYNEKDIFFWVLLLKDLIGLHRTVQLQLVQRYCLRYRLELLCYWMVCLGNEQRSFCRLWDCIQVLHFRLFCWPRWLFHFFWGIPARSSRYNGHLS